MAAGALLAATGCTTGTEPTEASAGEAPSATPAEGTSDPTPSSAAAGGPTDGAWVLESGEVDGEDLVLVDDATVTLLVADGRASGTAACNTYTTDVDTSDGWRIGEAAVTRMACEDALMTLESSYLDALARVRSAEASGDQLELEGPDVRLTFASDAEAG